MIAKRLTHWLTDAERHQVSEFIADETEMRKALDSGSRSDSRQVRMRTHPPAHFDARRSHMPSDFAISARFSSWLPSAAQLREMFVSTVARRGEFLGSAARRLYSAA